MISFCLKLLTLLICFKVIYSNLKFGISRVLNSRVWKNIQGRWILITGATDGIGKEIALILARKKQNLIIMGRNSAKLEETCKEIQKHTKCKIILKDFSVEQSFDDLFTDNIGMLINNVGVSSEHCKDFVDEDRISQIINVNNLNTIKLTQAVLRKMQKRSYIINLGSKVADFPSPLLSVYSASKKMIKSWSNSLSYELNHKFVHVEYVNLNFIATKMSKIRKANLFAPSPHDFAKSLLESIGTFNENTPYLFHLLANGFLFFIPSFVLGYVMLLRNSMVKEAALRKKSK